MRKMDIRFDVTGKTRKLLLRGDLIFGALAFAQDGLSGFLVVPKIGFGGFYFESLQLFAVAGNVKDSSVPARCALSALRSDVRGLRES